MPPIAEKKAGRIGLTSEGDSPIFVERKLGQSPTYFLVDPNDRVPTSLPSPSHPSRVLVVILPPPAAVGVAYVVNLLMIS